MAKQSNIISATNSFDGGMIADLHPSTTPNNAYTDAVGMELITLSDNQYLFQNIQGDAFVDTLGGVEEDGNYYFFEPLATKVYGNITYILSGAFSSTGRFITGTIGSFPSPDWAAINADSTQKIPLRNKYSAFHNFRKESDPEGIYESPFISKKLAFSKKVFLDLTIQGEYDGSSNLVFTDGITSSKIINSRFKVDQDSRTAQLADRIGTGDSNTYSDEDWDSAEVIQLNNFPLQVEGPLLENEGELLGGGYLYVFRYVTQEGNTSGIVYESPLVSISAGNLGISSKEISTTSVKFRLTELDFSYSGIQIYFVHISGEGQKPTTKAFKLSKRVSYSDGTTEIEVIHTGTEVTEEVDIEDITNAYTPIKNSRCLAIVNERLAMANVITVASSVDNELLRKVSESITIWEREMTLTTSYADPDTVTNKLGYWRGEVYEIGIVWMLKEGGLSSVFPVVGMDNLLKEQSTWSSYPDYSGDGFFDTDGFNKDQHMLNTQGVFRTSLEGNIYTPGCSLEDPGKRHIIYLEADTSKLSSFPELDKSVTGFFIVRRKREKNVIMQGMMYPTLALPALTPPAGNNDFTSTDKSANRRFLTVANDRSTGFGLGLNSGFESEGDMGNELITYGWGRGARTFSHDDKYRPELTASVELSYVPQPTQVVNIHWSGGVTSLSGSLCSTTTNKVIGINQETPVLRTAFFSTEVEFEFEKLDTYLLGSNISVEFQKAVNEKSPEGYTDARTNSTFSLTGTLYNNLFIGDETLTKDNYTSPWMDNFKGEHVTRLAQIVTSGNFLTVKSKHTTPFVMRDELATNSGGLFSSKADRSLGYYAPWFCTYAKSEWTSANAQCEDSTPIAYRPRGDYASGKHKLWSSSVVNIDDDSKGNVFEPYAIMTNAYSKYVGFEFDPKKDSVELPKFYYIPRALRDTSPQFSDDILPCDAPSGGIRMAVNVGHLANIFLDVNGRWTVDDIITKYKVDSGYPFHTITKRFKLEEKSIPLFQGDGFISRIFKRYAYKIGIEETPGLSDSEINTYGVGPIGEYYSDSNSTEFSGSDKDDRGHNLRKAAQIIEIATYSNQNADLRSVERVSAEETAVFGTDRSFFPQTHEGFNDSRADSVAYNKGYTGDVRPITYFRANSDAPVILAEFPNRVVISEANITQQFYNAFRDFRGFNFRDYGVELGPIFRLLSLKSVLITVHPGGILAIGIDDRELAVEGSDVYVNTAKVLSPKPAVISEVYGTVHSESVIRTDATFAGVDYNASAVWMIEGDKLTVISEYVIKSILNEFKRKIEESDFENSEEGITYVSRVFSTFDHSKHVLTVTYLAEHPDTAVQHVIGAVTYSTVLKKWQSRMTHGTKFAFVINAGTYTFGFSDRGNNIWKSESLVNDLTGEPVFNTFHGEVYEYGFEIAINKEVSLEKILNNIRVMCNKNLPVEIIYTTSGEVNDAAINIFEDAAKEKTVTQKLVTRNSSPRSALRLGILDENVYYKNSSLYIEVGKSDAAYSEKSQNKLIRDKYISVRFRYKGTDKAFIQGIISLLSVSYS